MNQAERDADQNLSNDDDNQGSVTGGITNPGAPTVQNQDIPVSQEGETQYFHSLFGPGAAGMWNHLKDNDVEKSKNQVFKRVENPQKPHIYVPHRLEPGYLIRQEDIMQGQVGQYIDFAKAIKYAATGTMNTNQNSGVPLMRYMTSQIERGEWGMPMNGPIRWEHAGGKTDNHFCTHALFPVKFTRTYAKKIDTFYMSYYVFYSSIPVKPNDQSFTPTYKPFTLAPDATVDGVGAGAVVNVDMTLINDENAILAIIASCQNSYAKSNSYITFIPRIDESLYTTSVNWSSPTRYTFGGASCGMAVFAAIKGWMSVLYTGYINAPVPGGKFITNEETREAMVQQRYGAGLRNSAVEGFQSGYQDDPWYLRADDRPPRPAGAPAVTPSSSLVSRVMAQPNFVESVGAIFSKIVYATAHKIPIFIPMQSSFRTDMVSYIARFRQSPKAIQWMGIVPTCYTAAMMEDGYPMITRSEQSATLNIVPNIFMPLTFTDANMMQLRFMAASSYNDTINAEVGFAGGSLYRDAQTKMFRQSRNEMIKLAANEATQRYAENAQERSAIKDARDEARRESLNRPDTYSLLQKTREPFKAARERKVEQNKQAKKEVTDRVKAKVKEIREKAKQGKMSLQQQMKAVKDTFMSLVKPTEQERKTYALDMKKLRESKPTPIKKQFAQFKGMTPQHQKFRKQDDGTYSEATKAAMKQLRAKNEKVITAYPSNNPGTSTAAQRKRAAELRGEQMKRDRALLEKYQNRFGAISAGKFAGARREREPESNGSSRGIVGDIASGVGDVLDILDI